MTNFSFLEGASHPGEMMVQAKALGLAAVGIADRNTLAGMVRALMGAEDFDIRLVVGVRLGFLDGTELIVFPRDRAAYGRLCRLLTLGKSEILDDAPPPPAPPPIPISALSNRRRGRRQARPHHQGRDPPDLRPGRGPRRGPDRPGRRARASPTPPSRPASWPGARPGPTPSIWPLPPCGAATTGRG